MPILDTAAIVDIAIIIISFVTFVCPPNGPYDTALAINTWTKYLRDSRTEVSETTIALIHHLWFFERLIAALGIWLFLLFSDWTDATSFIAIAALFFLYSIMDWYCWPGLYFYPMNQKKNYYFVAGTYVLGTISLILAWTIMIVWRVSRTPGFFWSSFSLMIFSTTLSLILGITLIYAHRGADFFVSDYGRSLARGRGGR